MGEKRQTGEGVRTLRDGICTPPAVGFSVTTKKPLTLECIRGFILLMVKTSGAGTLRSGELAKATGLSVDTVRHYEKIGVLPRASRTEKGYRVYSSGAISRVLIVQRALRIGFSLSELAEVLKARDAGGAPCHRVFQLAKGKLSDLEREINSLKQMRRYLKKVLFDWEKRIQQTERGTKSQLLDSLGESPKLSGTLPNRFRRNTEQ
jgi:DNA-binding transcriptional MerR regulator